MINPTFVQTREDPPPSISVWTNGCLDRDGDGVSDQYDSEPDDPEVAFTSEFVRTTLAGRYDFYTWSKGTEWATMAHGRDRIRYRSEW